MRDRKGSDTPPVRRRLWWLVPIALFAGYLSLLVWGYRVPFGGSFNRGEAGSVAQWTGALLTGGALVVGAQALAHELRAAERSRLEDRLSEANSVALVLDYRTTGPVRRVDLKVRNFGRLKIRSMVIELRDVEARGEDRDLWPQIVAVVLPQESVQLNPLLLARSALAGTDARMWFEIRWTDAWNVSHTMRADELLDEPYGR